MFPRTALVLCLLLAPVARAITIPVYSQADEINVMIYNPTPRGWMFPITTLYVPWSLEVYGRVDTEALLFHVDSLTGISPTEPLSFAHGPYTTEITIDPPGFEPPYTETVTKSYAIDLEWVAEDFQMVGGLTLPLHPNSLDGGIAFAPFVLGQVTVSISGTYPAVQTADLFAAVSAGVRCTQEPIGCAMSAGLQYTGAGAIAGGHQILAGGGPSSSLSGAVPEPSAALLLLAALAALGARTHVSQWGARKRAR